MQKLDPTDEDIESIKIQFQLLIKVFQDRGFSPIQFSKFLIAESAKGFNQSKVKKREYLKVCDEAFDTFK
jgi:hypothetical protein